MPSLRELAGHAPATGSTDAAGADTLPLLQVAAERARERIARLDRLAEQARELADVDYDFLYDRSRHLLAIGYNVDERRLDASYYDLLASEARLASFVAIAQGQLPQEAGSRSAACSRPPAASRRCCRGAARCSNT